MCIQNIIFTFASDKTTFYFTLSNIQNLNMKKTINTLCITIICVIAASVIMPTYQLGYYFGAGFQAGWNAESQESLLKDNTPLSLAFIPDFDKLANVPDTIIDNKSGDILPIALTQGALYVPDNKIPQWYTIIAIICELGLICTAITLLVKFIRLIININKDKIFEHTNVKLLRHIGLMLLIITLIQLTLGVTGEIVVETLPYQFTGYTYGSYWQLPWSNLLLGLVSLLMAQIWHRGIKMREEQELTI